MPPRAPKSSTESSVPPRRSSRISAQPKSDAAEVQETVKKTVEKSNKRSGDKAQAENPVAKKSKADEPETQAASGAEPEEPQLQPIDVGDSLPSVTLKNEKDEDVDVATLAAEKGVIFFLVPKADTPGCTNQACGFRDSYPDFSSLKFDVYCLSADTPAAQSKWQTKHNLPYPLLSDRKQVLITALGAGEGGKTKRSHFIFEKGGKLLDKKIPVKPADSPKLALEFVKSLNEA